RGIEGITMSILCRQIEYTKREGICPSYSDFWLLTSGFFLMNDEHLRVLIIDDEQFHAEAVAESLERVGYDCVVATSGQAGARKIAQDEWDVILTDLRMSDMDGLAILRKAKEETPEAEVVLITG